MGKQLVNFITISPIEHDDTKETPNYNHLNELLGRSCENLNDNQSKMLESSLRKHLDVHLYPNLKKRIRSVSLTYN
jgi:hypothetical protein